MMLTEDHTDFIHEDIVLRLDINRLWNVIAAAVTVVSYDEILAAFPVKLKHEPNDDDHHVMPTTSQVVPPASSPRRPSRASILARSRLHEASIAPSPLAFPAIPAFQMNRNPEAQQVSFAPCINGTVVLNRIVIWYGLQYMVKGIADNGHHRAFAHIVSDQSRIEASVPCSNLRLLRWEIPSPPVHGLPTCSFDIVQLAFSIIKENLLSLENKHKQRPIETFDVMEYRRVFTTAFNFNGRPNVCYRLEAGETAQWDIIFGDRWDVVVGGEYLVAKISFKRE